MASVTAPGAGSGRAGTVPLANGRLHTHARFLVPSGRNGGHLNMHLDSGIAIRFNKPIDTSTFTPANFSVTGRAAAIPFGGISLAGDVQTGLDIENGLITLTLTCSDTNTGAFPEDAFAGFLPPNRPELACYETNITGCCGPVDTNILIQPGQGYVSYTVRPRTNLVSGT